MLCYGVSCCGVLRFVEMFGRLVMLSCVVVRGLLCSCVFCSGVFAGMGLLLVRVVVSVCVSHVGPAFVRMARFVGVMS